MNNGAGADHVGEDLAVGVGDDGAVGDGQFRSSPLAPLRLITHPRLAVAPAACGRKWKSSSVDLWVDDEATRPHRGRRYRRRVRRAV